MDLLENIPLAQYTTLGVGGPARWFIETEAEGDILAAVRFAREQAAPFFILGGGSNLLIGDKGFPGVVIRIADGDAAQISDARDGIATLTADAGADWDTIVTLAVEKNCAGIECLAGIPGSVGGTPVQNVGAYGQEVASSIVSVRALDLAAEKVVDLTPADCGFSYRRSIFNMTHIGRYAITRVTYALKPGGAPHLEYRDVKLYFAEHGIRQPTLSGTAEAIRIIRARKGMSLDPNDADSHSAGSFFKNPIIPASTVARLATIAGCVAEEVPQFPAGAGFAHKDKLVKLSAAWLIELAGFYKGFRMGRAGLSTKHVLAIINRGSATAAEIVALRDAITLAVQVRTGIKLEQEPVMLGFQP